MRFPWPFERSIWRWWVMLDRALFRHGWWSLRGRFWIALAVVVVHAVVVVIVYAQIGGEVPGDWQMSPEDRSAVEVALGGSYRDYLSQRWGGGGLGGLLVILGVILGAGGAAAERRQGTGGLSLSLPVQRSGWLLSRLVLVLGLLLVLALLSAVIVTAGAVPVGAELPVGLAVAGGLLSGLVATYGIAVALLATVWTRDTFRAALLSLVALYVIDAVTAGWRPGTALSVTAWTSGPPWGSLAVVVVMTGALFTLAVQRFKRVDP